MARFRRFVLAGVATAVVCVSNIYPTQANTLTVDFNVLNGVASAPGGQATFSLNGDGTIAASVVLYVGQLVGFGFDSAGTLTESNFSSPVSNTSGWGNMYGNYQSGWACFGPCISTNTNTWTIGNLGQFSSAFDALGGGSSVFDFFMYDNYAQQWAGNAVAVSAVPLPAALPLFAAGLSAMGFMGWRRKRKALAN